MRCARVLIAVLACLALAGCAGNGPQRPSQRKGQTPEPDSTEMALLELNMQLAKTADEQLLRLAQAQEEPYALYEGNIWMHISDRGDTDGPTPKRDEEWLVHMRIHNLDGKLLQDTEGTYRIGKYELPPAIDNCLRDMHHGGRARLYAPWYAAFGIKGTDAVPPYENIIIDIELK